MPLESMRNGPLNVRQWGDGIPVLLVHGLGTSSDIWCHQVRPLSRRYRVIAIDVAGFGRSGRSLEQLLDCGREAIIEDLVEVCERAGQPVHYVGTSMGGFFGQMLARQRSDLVRSLFLCNTAGRNVIPPDVVDARLELLRSASMDEVAALVADQALHRPFDPVLWEWLREIVARTAPDVYGHFLTRIIGGFDLRHELPAISLPTLVLTGARDRVIPPQHGAEIARLIPGSRHRELAEVGHIACAENPAEFNRLVLGFLEAVDRKQAA